MILEGKRKGNGVNKVRLYQDEEEFKAARDEDFHQAPQGVTEWSSKGAWFDDLEAAKNYIQMARDEEGVFWEWPRAIPVIWKKGPFTEADKEVWGKDSEVPEEAPDGFIANLLQGQASE